MSSGMGRTLPWAIQEPVKSLVMSAPAFEVALDVGDGFGGGVGLGHEEEQPARQGVAQVVGDAVGRVERGAGGVDLRAGEFAGLDAAADGQRVAEVGAAVDDGGEAAAGEHVRQLGVELRGGFPFRAGPFGLGEVDVGVPEAGGDDAVVAGQDGGSGGDGDIRADSGDAAIDDEDGAVGDWRIGGEV
jgi:hypothetical protein